METVLGGYFLERFLGEGGAGSVFVARAVDPVRTADPVALKVLHRDCGAGPGAVRRFRREAGLMQNIAHPNVVRILSLGEEAQHQFFVTELQEGPTLRERLGTGPLAGPELTGAGQELLAALGAIHGVGIVHRDLTPSNLMFHRGSLRVLDFGLAQMVGETTLTRSRGIRMTRAYAPPERLRGQRPSSLSDIYQAGLVLFEMATGRRPFDDGDPSVVAMAHLSGRSLAASALNLSLPPLLDHVLARALKPDPKQRYRSVAALASDFTFVMQKG